MELVTLDSDVLQYTCPHCDGKILTAVSEIACGVFRHGFNIVTNTQISPHESKELCNQYRENPQYVGCCKPYQIVKKENDYIVSICDYI